MHTIRISIVGYTNTLPFRYGIAHFFNQDSNEISVSNDYPAICAEKLKNKEADIGLVPVAVLKDLPDAKIITPFCLGSNGKVDSVKLYSNVPLNEITEIVLDYQSRTSVKLVQVLCKEFWKIHPIFSKARPGFEEEVAGTKAAVIIGDRTFNLGGKYKYEFDLAEEWHKMTGLPFVFAVWVSTKDLAPQFLSKFEEALAYGNNHIEEAIRQFPVQNLTAEGAIIYLKDRMNYLLDSPKKEALARFLAYL